MTRRWLTAAGVALACASSGALTPVRAAVDFAGLLRPGSRAELGLGGDPFRSPLRDECGWWSEPEFARFPHVRAVSRSSEPLAEGVGAGGKLSAVESWWQVEGGTRLAGRPVWLTGRFSQLRWDGALDASDGGLELSSEGSSADAAVRIDDVLPGLSAQAAAPLWSEPGSSPRSGVGMRYRWRSVVVQSAWSKSQRTEVLRSDLQGEPLSASVDLRSEQLRADARVGLPGWLTLELSAGRERYPVAARRSVAAYQLGSGGSSNLGQLSLEWAASRALRVLARHTRAELDIDGEASWGGERFGQLSYARGGLRSSLVAAEARLGRATRVVLDAERAEVDGRARGVLETWPFTTALTDLLGLRQIGRAEARAHWHRAHAGVERVLGLGGGRLQVGASWFDIWPDASVESWRPAFLVFGRADYRVDRLGFGRAQLAAASLGLDWRFGSLECGVALEQFVFARVFENASSAGVPDPSPAPSGPSERVRGGGWPGGTSFELSLGRRF